MKLLKTALAAATLIGPLVVLDAPAQALTAKQYHAQGHGRYLTSKGRPYGYGHYGRYHYRHPYYRHHYHHHHGMYHHHMY